MHLGRLVAARRVRRRCLAICVALPIVPWTMASAAAVCHVNGAASGANTGGSWTDAYTDLQSALTDANCTEVWVASGVYKPAAADRTVSFAIRPDVAVYGGFSGGEAHRDARDPAAHVTILSGDIDNNDTGTNGIDIEPGNIVGSNTRHIVMLDGTVEDKPVTATTVIDGFTLTGGDNTNNTNGGGALWCRGNGAGHACSPTLARLVFSGNKAINGGAMALDGYSGGVSSPTLTNVVFSGNSAGTFGGAMFNNGQLAGGASSPVLTNVTFNNNHSATYGGAMFNDGSGNSTSSPTLTNVTFDGNSAGSSGGAMFNNAGSGTSSPTLTNSTFYGNTAGSNGGAMYTTCSSGTSTPKLINATFTGNSANNGGAIYVVGVNSFPLLLNSVVWDDSATTSGPEFFLQSGGVDLYDSVIQNGCAANGCGGMSNSMGDPLLGALADNGGFVQTMMPGPGSAAIDAVGCSYSTEEPIADARGAVRPDSGSAGATRCDIGAVEANSLPGDLIFADRFGSHPWDDF